MQERTSRQVVLPLRSEADLRKWDRLDDVIMGGQSESKLKLGEARTASWEGILRVEGGGFCGCRAKACPSWELACIMSVYTDLHVLC